jgi:serine/threonine-protein kinase RsbW
VKLLEVPSETRRLAEVRAFVEAAAAEAGIDLAEARRLAIAVDEAVSNVIEHGYRGRADGRIEVELRLAPSRAVEVRIRDDGARFDSSRLPVQPRVERLDGLRSRGYGLVLIHRLVDEVHYSPRGSRVNELVLVRRLEGGKRIPGTVSP